MTPPQWFSSGTSFYEYAKGGHYKMSKADKRENIIMVCVWIHVNSRAHMKALDCERASYFRVRRVPFSFVRRALLNLNSSGLDGNSDKLHGRHHPEDEPSADPNQR